MFLIHLPLCSILLVALPACTSLLRLSFLLSSVLFVLPLQIRQPAETLPVIIAREQWTEMETRSERDGN
jgi:hypothetical protein